ncbi:hypothetical protein R5R35_002042 [Gryllus longicercus]|uniref:Uncharacterized protein n=1 Tax=Gryllus longicercus TaxID=2509291 RepID=A0AAN9V8G4_9ORTH
MEGEGQERQAQAQGQGQEQEQALGQWQGEELGVPANCLRDIRESLLLAERLASASLLTSPSAKRRLAARRAHMDWDDDAHDAHEAHDAHDAATYVPPKQVLLYLVR